MENQLIKKPENSGVSIFSTLAGFEHWQRVAKMISSSTLVPRAYQGNVSNTMIAIELANRIGISPFMVMQNLDVIQGKPSWNSTFIISAINSCGRFEPLRFEFEGEKGTEEFGCRAITKDKSGAVLKGPKVDWKMVKSEGWLSKNGSKWKTMPELMFHYRAASFFGRLYAPDILKGMHSVDEVTEMTEVVIDQKQMDEEEEENRAIHFIATAESVEQLEQVKPYVEEKGGDLLKDYQKKEKELKAQKQ